ncbi:YjfB family protein [Sulfurivirga sp.]|uniref:YjfB family protein n=1 Tax=Sulfurivirga sp. TaxID=2614236 RepID=UPI0025D20963|nr:YjfB family protein [Sulfurivirga sp.]
MDISNVSPGAVVSAVMAQQEASVRQSAQITMFKKALDMQTQGILQLIASVPGNPRAGLPDHIGQNINTTA